MHSGAPPVLEAWRDFYVIIGSSAAALTGLVFIVITLVAGDRSRSTSGGISTFSSPTVVHFCAALLVALTLAAPWHGLRPPAAVLGVAGLYGAVYSVMIARGMRKLHRDSHTYEPQTDDWLWYVAIPLVAYLALDAAALALAAAHAGALFAVAGVTAVLIFVGIHNAWDVVTFIALKRDDADAGDGDPPQA